MPPPQLHKLFSVFSLVSNTKYHCAFPAQLGLCNEPKHCKILDIMPSRELVGWGPAVDAWYVYIRKSVPPTVFSNKSF